MLPFFPRATGNMRAVIIIMHSRLLIKQSLHKSKSHMGVVQHVYLWKKDSLCDVCIGTRASRMALDQAVFAMEAIAEVNWLLVELPTCQSLTEALNLFVEEISKVYVGLNHASILLLPAEPVATGISTCQATQAAGSTAGKDAAIYKADQQLSIGSGDNNRGAKDASDNTSTNWRDRVHAFLEGCGLDWSNCCVFDISASRGAVTQPTPPWPVTCTATCYAAAVVQDTVTSDNYTADGPHFLDWNALAELGSISMAAVPMSSCGRPVAVLCLASKQVAAFSDVSLLHTLGRLLAPYCTMLNYSTRETELRKLLNSVIAPTAAILSHQQQSRLNNLDCTSEKAASSCSIANGKGITAAVCRRHCNKEVDLCGSVNNSSSSLILPQSGLKDSSTSSSSSSSAGIHDAAATPATAAFTRPPGQLGSKSNDSFSGLRGCIKASVASGRVAEAGTAQLPSHTWFASLAVERTRYQAPSKCRVAASANERNDDVATNIGAIVIYMGLFCIFCSSSFAAGDIMLAILLYACVAGLDVMLMKLQCASQNHLVAHRIIKGLLHGNRLVVLPMANTWTCWRLLRMTSIKPNFLLALFLGTMLVTCMSLGLQERFYLQAPLQTTSVLLAAVSTPYICAVVGLQDSARCVSIVSALQLGLGVLLPCTLGHVLETSAGRAFLKHMQAQQNQKWL